MRAALAAALALGLLGCQFDAAFPSDEERLSGGGGIETVGIRGYAYHENGAPAVHAQVLIRAREFLADSGIEALKKQYSIVSGETVTDARGFYAIDSVTPGEYRIEVAAEDKAEGAVVEALVYGDTRTLEVEKAVVKAPGSLVGRLVRAGAPVAGAWAHVYGMQRASASDAYGRFAFADLPEGDFHLIIRMRQPYGYLQTLTLPSVGVTAGQIKDLGALDFPGGCDAAACDSLVVRYLLDANGLDTLPVDSVSQWDSTTGRLEGLDLSGRGIEALPYAQDLVTLKRLELDNNGLQAMPPEVTRLSRLEYLSLNYNRLRTLPREIGNLKSLIGLHLFSNLIDSLPPSIGNLFSLRYLTLSYNLLRALPAETSRLYSLNQLYMHHNRLEDMPESLLDLPKLSLIDIHSNRLCNLSLRWQAALDKGATYDWRAFQSCIP